MKNILIEEVNSPVIFSNEKNKQLKDFYFNFRSLENKSFDMNDLKEEERDKTPM